MSGFRIFSAGDAGAAHALAHQALDGGQARRGHRQLGAWLRGRAQGAVSTSDWAHLHWHMMVFELEVGDIASAVARYRTHVLPAALDADAAATDGPSGMWRIALAANVSLPWNEMARAARAFASADDSDYVALHRVLALAGSADVAGIDRWRSLRRPAGVLDVMTRGLCALASGDMDDAASLLARGVPHVHSLGGSHAQNELFANLQQWAADRVALRRAA